MLKINNPNDLEEAYYMAFNFKQYISDQGNDHYPNSDNVPSGAYIFKPDKANPNSVGFSQFVSTKNNQADFVQELVLEYDNPTTHERARVRIYAYEKSPIYEFNVHLNGIPKTKTGNEVIVTFTPYDFDNNKTFYTDSNGLEMQTRVLNQRPDFTVSSNQKVSSNYYPINSCISIQDTNPKKTM